MYQRSTSQFAGAHRPVNAGDGGLLQFETAAYDSGCKQRRGDASGS
jgi:hypothetical protein